MGFMGLAGKLLGGVANHYTGGLVGKAANLIKEHSGLIGKVTGGIGRAIVPDKVRNALSTVADAALKLVPEGEVKSTLSKINDAAQGRERNLSNTKTNQYKSSDSRIAPGEGSIYGSSTAPRNKESRSSGSLSFRDPLLRNVNKRKGKAKR